MGYTRGSFGVYRGLFFRPEELKLLLRRRVHRVAGGIAEAAFEGVAPVATDERGVGVLGAEFRVWGLEIRVGWHRRGRN